MNGIAFMAKIIAGLAAGLILGSAALADEMKMAVTTSFQNSGLAEVLLPAIREDTGIELQLLVVGTGQALRLGAAGDVDAILVHARAAEEEFVAQGNAPHRTEIMYNDFVVIGPGSDPSDVKAADSAAQAFRRIAAGQYPFVSRGDESGTHKKEQSLWAAADIDPGGAWYKAVGAGMGAALNTASGMNAYILSDRASWLNFGNRGELQIVFQGDPVLFNQYAYLPVSKAKHPQVKAGLAARVEAWLVSDRARSLIDGYRLEGERLFTFNAQQ